MAKVSWDDYTPINASSQNQQNNAPVSWSNLTPIPQPHSAIENIGAGIVSPAIAAGNLVLHGAHKIAPSLIGHHTIPEIPHDRGVQYALGNIIGTTGAQFIPGLDVGADIGEAAEGAGAAARLARLPSKLPSFAQRAVKGGGIAFATSPGNVEQRGISAGLGGVLSSAVPAVGNILKMPVNTLKNVSKNVVAKAVNPLQDFVHTSLNGRVGDASAEDALGGAYQSAKKAVNWEGLQPLAQKADEAQMQQPLLPSTTAPKKLPPDIQKKYNLLQKKPSTISYPGTLKLMTELKQRDPAYTIQDLHGIEKEVLPGTLPSQSFNPKTYKDQGQAILEQAQNQENDDPSTFKGLANQIQTKLNLAPTSFEKAIAQKKAINQMPSSWDKTTNDAKINASRHYAGLLGHALDNSVKDQASTPEAQNFLNQWHTQRKNYGDLQQFYNNPNKVASFDPALKNHLENGNYDLALNNYIPKAGETSPVKIEALQHLVGNDDLAHKTLLNQFLQKYKNPNTQQIDALKLGKAINAGNVSPTLMPLLTHDEKVGLGNIVHSKNIADSIQKSPGIVNRLSRHPLVTGASGAILGHGVGLPLVLSPLSFLGGAEAPKTAQNMLARAYEDHADKLLKSGRLDRLKELSDLFDEKGGRIAPQKPPTRLKTTLQKLSPVTRRVGQSALLAPGQTVF